MLFISLFSQQLFHYAIPSETERYLSLCDSFSWLLTLTNFSSEQLNATQLVVLSDNHKFQRKYLFGFLPIALCACVHTNGTCDLPFQMTFGSYCSAHFMNSIEVSKKIDVRLSNSKKKIQYRIHASVPYILIKLFFRASGCKVM